jgi:transcriptional regulator GlxA family with amidase domain
VDPRVYASLRAIEPDRTSQGFDVAGMAARVGLSRSRCEYLFTRDMGVSFKSYVRALRLRKAEELLRDWTVSVKEVAWKIGYRHASSFTRAYRQEFGSAPSRHRRGLPQGQPTTRR